MSTGSDDGAGPGPGGRHSEEAELVEGSPVAMRRGGDEEAPPGVAAKGGGEDEADEPKPHEEEEEDGNILHDAEVVVERTGGAPDEEGGGKGTTTPGGVDGEGSKEGEVTPPAEKEQGDDDEETRRTSSKVGDESGTFGKEEGGEEVTGTFGKEEEVTDEVEGTSDEHGGDGGTGTSTSLPPSTSPTPDNDESPPPPPPGKSKIVEPTAAGDGEESSAPEEPPRTRKRGRPPGPKGDDGDAEEGNKGSTSTSTSASPVRSRGRGRPTRGYKNPPKKVEDDGDTDEEEVSSTPVRRGRGRPIRGRTKDGTNLRRSGRRNDDATTTTTTVVSPSSPKKKRGRGRPRKILTEDEESEAQGGRSTSETAAIRARRSSRRKKVSTNNPEAVVRKRETRGRHGGEEAAAGSGGKAATKDAHHGGRRSMSMTPGAIRSREFRRKKREEEEDIAAEEDAKARGLSMTPRAIKARRTRRARQRQEEARALVVAVEEAKVVTDEDDDDEDYEEEDEEYEDSDHEDSSGLTMTKDAVRARRYRGRKKREAIAEHGGERDERGLSTNPDAVRKREAYRRRRKRELLERSHEGEDGPLYARDEDGLSTNPDAVYRRDLRRRRREEEEVFAVLAAERGEEPPSGAVSWMRRYRRKKRRGEDYSEGLSMTPGAVRKREARRRRMEEEEDVAAEEDARARGLSMTPRAIKARATRRRRQREEAAAAALSSSDEEDAATARRRAREKAAGLSMTPGAIRKREARRRKMLALGVTDDRSRLEAIRKREYMKKKRGAGDYTRDTRKRKRKKVGADDGRPEEEETVVTDPRVVGARVHAEVRHVLTTTEGEDEGARLYAECATSKFLAGTVVHVEEGGTAATSTGGEEDREDTAPATTPCLVTAVYRLGDGDGATERRRTLEVDRVRAGDPHPGWVADPRLIVGGNVHAMVRHVLTTTGEDEGADGGAGAGGAQQELYGHCAESKFIPGTVVDVEETTVKTGDENATSLFVTAVYRLKGGGAGMLERRVRLELDLVRPGDPSPVSLADPRTIMGTPVHALATDVMGKEEAMNRFGPRGGRLYLRGRVTKVEGKWNLYVTALYRLPGEGEGDEEEVTGRLMIHFVKTGEPPEHNTEHLCKTVDPDGTRCEGWAGEDGWCHVHRENRCTADGCEREPVAHEELCYKHHHQKEGSYLLKRCCAEGCHAVAWGGTKLCTDHKDQIVPQVKECALRGCHEEAREYEGYCPYHAVRRCQVEGCHKHASCKGGKCRKHGIEVGLCEIEGCVKQATVGGICKEHRKVESTREVGGYKVFDMSSVTKPTQQRYEEDTRRVVGNRVHAKALKVLGTISACQKLYGPLSQLLFLGGTVVEVGIGTGRHATKTTSCFITAKYELGNGEEVTKRLNIRSVMAGDPPKNMKASPVAAAQTATTTPTADRDESSNAAASTTDNEDEANEPRRKRAVADKTDVALSGKESGEKFTSGSPVYAQALHVVPSLYERIEIFGSSAKLKLLTGTVTDVESVEGQSFVTAVYQLPSGEEEEVMRPAILVNAGVPSPMMLQSEKDPCRVVGAKVHSAVKLVLGGATDGTSPYLKSSACKFVPGTVVDVETIPSDEDPDLILCFVTAVYDLGGGVERRQRLSLEYVYAGDPHPSTVPDPRTLVGTPVHALAIDVLGNAECLRRFGPKNKIRYFGGSVVGFEEDCFAIILFQLGEGEELRKRLNICFLKVGEPPKKKTKHMCKFVDSDGKRCEGWRGTDGYCPHHRDYSELPVEKQCKADGCERPALPSGFCRGHGEQKPSTQRVYPRCCVQGCEKLARNGKKVCMAHKESDIFVPVRICSVDGCNEEARKFGFRCTGHITNMDLCKVKGCHKWARQGGKCTTHGAKVKLCDVEGCTNMCKKQGKCTAHGTRTIRLCEVDGCETQAYSGGRCCKHGSKTVCNVLGCKNQARQKGRCIRHGAKHKRCKVDGCEKRAQYYGLCGAHGGKKLCDVEGCENNVVLHGKCRNHGGLRKSYGRKCRVEGCEKFAKGGGKCIAHGGTRLRCQVEGCPKQAIQARLCIAHGGVEQRKKKRRKVSTEAQEDTFGGGGSSPAVGVAVGTTEYESQPPVQDGRSALLWAAEASYAAGYRGFS